MVLEVDDIQHFLISPPALVARCEFLTFRRRASGREWLKGLIGKVGTAKTVASQNPTPRWVSIGFTWNGLRSLGANEAALSSFPEEFREGMAARAEMLGITGASHPDNWVGGLAAKDLHAIVILFAHDIAERERCRQEHREYLLQHCDGVKVLSALDLEAIPPFAYAHEHPGYRDRVSQFCIEGIGEEPTPNPDPPIKPGEFFLGYPDEEGTPVGLPEPEVLFRNGSYVAYLRLEEHVAALRDFLRQHGDKPEQQKWIPAKLTDRWRSGTPLVLPPHKDDRDLGNGARRRKMIRREGTYGPRLPEDKFDDGIERGIAEFLGCASLLRQFEFAMNVWANNLILHEPGDECGPIFGTHDTALDMPVHGHPVRERMIALTAFTTIRGGAYFFLPGLRALQYLSRLS